MYSRSKNWPVVLSFEFGQQHYNEILITLGRLFRAEILKLILGGLQQKLESWVPTDLCVRSMLEENHGKCWSNWPVAGPSGCRLPSDVQTNPNGSPHCAVENLQTFTADILVTLRWDEQQMRNNPRLYSLQSNNNVICHFTVRPVRGGPNKRPTQECNNGTCWYSLHVQTWRLKYSVLK